MLFFTTVKMDFKYNVFRNQGINYSTYFIFLLMI